MDAFSTVSERVRMAGEVSARAFLCWSPDIRPVKVVGEEDKE